MASALRAGKAIIELSLLSEGIEKQLKSIHSKLSGFGSGLKSVGATAVAAGGVITGAFAGCLAVFTQVGSAVADMQSRTGASAEFIQQLGFGLKQAGADASQLQPAFQSMNAFMLKAERGSSKVVKTLGDLGLSVQDLAGLTPEEKFTKFAEAISKIDEPGRRAALAAQVFGGAAQAMLPILANGAAGIQEIQRAANAAGIVMSGDAVQSADAFGDAIDLLKDQATAVAAAIGASIAPALTAIATTLSESVLPPIIQFIQNNSTLVAGIGAIGVALVGLGTILVTAGTALAGLAAAATALSLPVTGPLALVVVGLAAVGAAMGAVILSSDTLRKKIAELTGELGEAIKLYMSFQKLSGAFKNATQIPEWNPRKEPPKAAPASSTSADANADNPFAESTASAGDAWDWIKGKFGDAADKIGDVRKKFTEAQEKVAAVVETALTNAQAAVQPIKSAQEATSLSMERNQPEAIFDTRFASQMFGTPRDEEVSLLRGIEKNTRKKQQSGIPVGD